MSFIQIVMMASFSFLLSSCLFSKDQAASIVAAVEASRYLYVASGRVSGATGCYGGGVTTSGASAANTIVRYNLSSGTFDKVIVDYSLSNDIPISIKEYNSKYLLVLVENTGGRRVDLVEKSTGSRSSFFVNGTALSGVVRDFKILSDNTLLISKSTAVEKVATPNVRLTVSGAPYINAPGGACATSTTLITSVAELPGGKLLFAHSAVSPNNKIGMVSQLGYSVVGDCLTTQVAPVATSLPTSMLVHSTGPLLVSYGSTTATSNAIYAYDVDETANTISNATSAYSTNTVINGPSAMTEDTKTGDVYIANATSSYN